MKKKNILRTIIASLVVFLAIPLPAYAFSYCSLHPVLAFLVLLLNIAIIFLIFYYPFKLITKIKSEKNYPKLFNINRVLFSLLFFLQFILPTVLSLIIISLIPDFYSELGNSIGYFMIFIPAFMLSAFAIWVKRKYGLKWGAKMLFVSFGAPLIYCIMYFSEDFAKWHHDGLYGAIENQIDTVFPPQCSGGLSPR